MLLGILPKVRDQIYVIENARPLKKKKKMGQATNCVPL